MIALTAASGENTVVAKSSSKGGGITQLPSNSTDFQNGDSSTITITFIKANKDLGGFYHVKGEIKNSGNETLSSLRIKTHWYDATMNLIGIDDLGFPTPDSIDPGQTATFDISQDPKDLNGTPKFYKLSYEWE